MDRDMTRALPADPAPRCGDPCQRYGDGARTLCEPCTGRNGVAS